MRNRTDIPPQVHLGVYGGPVGLLEEFTTHRIAAADITAGDYLQFSEVGYMRGRPDGSCFEQLIPETWHVTAVDHNGTTTTIEYVDNFDPRDPPSTRHRASTDTVTVYRRI